MNGSDNSCLEVETTEENFEFLKKATFLKDFVQYATERFISVGIESAEVDAELLAGHILGLSRGEVQAQILLGASVSETQIEQLVGVYARRLMREPLQHITRVAYFRKLELLVGRGVFIPRPETEFIAQLAIDAVHNALTKTTTPIAVDLGTGSGAIALSIATENPQAKVYAVEKSAEAFTFAKFNFVKYEDSCDATLEQGDLADAFQELNGTVSVVVSNPPYIPLAAIPRDIEVRLYDPAAALYGGDDGMEIMRLVSATAKRLLVSGGVLIVEHADSQSAQVRQLLLADGWREVRAHRDLTDRDRAITAIK